MAGPVVCASGQQWVPDFAPNTLLLDSCDAMSDLLCLRHDQQLEYAKEYNSIVPEPLGSHLRPRSQGRRAGPKGDDLSRRPAWVGPGKCAGHPWRPLQWDHVSQAQLIAFEAGLRGTPPSPEAADQQPSQARRTVAWEDDEQLAGGSRQTASRLGLHHQQLQQQQQLRQKKLQQQQLQKQQQLQQQQQQRQQHKVQQQQKGQLSHNQCDARQDWRAGVPGPAHAIQAGKSVREAAMVSPKSRSCSPVVQHSTQGYGALYSPKQASVAVSGATCQHSHGQQLMHQPCREAMRQQSAGKQRSKVVGSWSHSRTKEVSERLNHEEENRVQLGMASMSPSPRRGASVSPSKGSPNQATVGSGKVQHRHAAGCTPQPVAACGPAQPAALARGSSQQKRQHERGLSPSPTHMQNWVRWESDQDQADRGPSGKGKLAATAFPSNAMAQATSQPAAVSQSAARDQTASSNNRHIMPCSGYSSPAQVPLATRGLPTQPLFSAPVGCMPLRVGSETGVEKGLRLGGDSDSRAAGVRYCLSSSEPAVGAGIWEEQTTRSWLREACLGVTSADEAAPLLQNPLRNGVLLCDLAGALEGRIVWGLNRSPKSLAAARSNVFAALGHLGMLTAQTCPRGLLHEVEHVLQGRQASIWGMLNHIRLTHPSAGVIGQTVEEQPVDRTLTSHEEACKPDRCSGAVAAATSPAGNGDCSNHAQNMVSVGPHGSIRCTSPVQRSPRQQKQQYHQQQQQKQQQLQSSNKRAGQLPCLYHDHETMTISLVGQANVYGSPARAVSPQRGSHKHASPSSGVENADHSCGNDAYVRLVSVRPAVERQQQGRVQPVDRSEAIQQERQRAPVRCPEPAAAASSSNRTAALAQLRMARRRQQQLSPADVEQHISEKMSARSKPAGCGANWSSRKKQERQQRFLSDAELVEWARSKGLKELLPGMLLEESFADGRLLCRLVGLLERNNLSGIEWRSPSVAASRHNVTKAMSELKKRPSMPLQNLWQAADVVKAEPGLVQALLNGIVQAYT